MLWTWVLVCLIMGELLIYFIMVVSKTLLPYQIAPPIRSMTMFYILCLGLFLTGGISFFSYNDTRERLKDLDNIYNQIVGVVEVSNTIMLMESSQRVFLITGDRGNLNPYNELKAKIDGRIESASKAYEGTSDKEIFRVFSDLVKNKVVLLDKNIETKKTSTQAEVEKNLLLSESRNMMSMLIESGRDLQNRRAAEYKRIMSGLWVLGSVRGYLSFTIMLATLVQIGLAAVLNRSRRPISSSGAASGETFFP